MKTKPFKILVFVPKYPKTDMWKCRVGQSNFKRKNVVAVYNLLERKIRRLLASRSPGIINVKVNYDALHAKGDKGWFNSGAYAQESDAFYALASFLEDYLPKQLLKSKYKLYAKYL